MDTCAVWNPLVTVLFSAVPIGAALIAGSLLLVRSSCLKRERVLRVRTHNLAEKIYPVAGGNAKGHKAIVEACKRAYRLPQPVRGTYLDIKVMSEMSAQPLEGYQIFNQYLLLSGALVSLALWPVLTYLNTYCAALGG